MATKRKFKSEAFEAIHSSARALLKVGAIDKATMREFDQSCVAMPAEIAPRKIKQICENNHVSQPVLAPISIQANRPSKNGKREQSVQAVWRLSWQRSSKSMD